MITRCAIVAEHSRQFVCVILSIDIESVNSTTGADCWRRLHSQRILRVDTRERDKAKRAIMARQMFA